MVEDEHDLQELLLDFTDLPSLESAIDEAFNKIDGRISYIVDNAVIKGTPIAKIILNYTDNPDDLAMLSKALDRLANLLPKLQEIESKRNLVKGISKEKGWLASQLGNFSSDIDLFLSAIDTETEGAS